MRRRGLTTAIRLTALEYEVVRGGEAQFLLDRGQERPEIEDVLVERQSWVVVRKRGGAAEVAAETNPRGRRLSDRSPPPAPARGRSRA
ncbi:MAG: hypothetical protein ACXWZB_02785 [Gaiellaceae bacterium]